MDLLIPNQPFVYKKKEYKPGYLYEVDEHVAAYAIAHKKGKLIKAAARAPIQTRIPPIDIQEP